MTTTAPSVYEIADILRGAHTAVRCYGWSQTEPPAGRGPVHALTAIGIGTVGWGYDPRTILNPHDEALYEATVARVARHLDLHDTDALEAFTAWHDDPERTTDDILHALQDTARGLEGYRTDRVITPTARDVTSVHQGVLLTCYGEDSNYMAIGHITPTLMVTASAECNLHLTGEPLASGWSQDRIERRVWHTWAVHWRDQRGEIWWDVDHDRRTPGAEPVTILPGD
ncbi:hypothetical protein [Streptomyces violaceusniger]|uniref:DUF6197 family protein n=1 Tax=Streptomyces violaceusniger TaxID=68280 RepID=UPI00380F8CF3